MKGVTSTLEPEAASMTPLENTEDPPMVWCRRRYHMNTRIAAPSSTRAVIMVLMIALVATLTCDVFDGGTVGCVAVGCGVVVVVLNWMSFTGILRTVSQPWEKRALKTDFWNNGANIAPCAALTRR